MKEQKYNAYLKEIGKFIPKDRIYTDELRLLAWGTDAGFYRLIPKIVIREKTKMKFPGSSLWPTNIHCLSHFERQELHSQVKA